MVRARLLAVLFLLACGSAPPPRPSGELPARTPPPTAPRVVTLTVVGTNDLHGHLHALPILGGYLRILRELRSQDGGVVLVDGGDMFQGTLESNLLEGAPVIAAYDALRYDAAAIGNHEFDYGPVGERATPAEGDDPRGALLARAAQSHFPLLNANLLRAVDREHVAWDNVTPSTVVERAGVRVGIVGVTTEHTLTTTIAANVRDLAIEPLADAIAREARALRERGADVVIVAAHAGGDCESVEDPNDLASCDAGEEIFRVAEALPGGAVDAIVAGHTHKQVAHVVHGVPIVESWSYGVAFGRIDLRVDVGAGRVLSARVFPPQRLCAEGSVDDDTCALPSYEDRPVARDPQIESIIAPAVESARAARERPLGVTAAGPIVREREAECALGNLFVDLMREARPGDVAISNGGGLRADLPAGPLIYGALYEASPFDNRFARVRMTGAELASMIAQNLGRDGSFFSIGGVRAEARCERGALQVSLRRENGRRIRDRDVLSVVTTDFLATGGDGAFGGAVTDPSAIEVEEGEPVREAMARVLERRGGTLDPARLYDSSAPRIRYPGSRPVRCE